MLPSAAAERAFEALQPPPLTAGPSGSVGAAAAVEPSSAPAERASDALQPPPSIAVPSKIAVGTAAAETPSAGAPAADGPLFEDEAGWPVSHFIGTAAVWDEGGKAWKWRAFRHEVQDEFGNPRDLGAFDTEVRFWSAWHV